MSKVILLIIFSLLLESCASLEKKSKGIKGLACNVFQEDFEYIFSVRSGELLYRDMSTKRLKVLRRMTLGSSLSNRHIQEFQSKRSGNTLTIKTYAFFTASPNQKDVEIDKINLKTLSIVSTHMHAGNVYTSKGKCKEFSY